LMGLKRDTTSKSTLRTRCELLVQVKIKRQFHWATGRGDRRSALIVPLATVKHSQRVRLGEANDNLYLRSMRVLTKERRGGSNTTYKKLKTGKCSAVWP